MANCKACGAWFSSTAPSELCPRCERELHRMNGYAVPVVHGRWIRKKNGAVECSECGCMTSIVFSDDAYDEVKTENNFCYNCGAKMDLEV